MPATLSATSKTLSHIFVMKAYKDITILFPKKIDEKLANIRCVLFERGFLTVE